MNHKFDIRTQFHTIVEDKDERFLSYISLPIDFLSFIILYADLQIFIYFKYTLAGAIRFSIKFPLKWLLKAIHGKLFCINISGEKYDSTYRVWIIWYGVIVC